MRSDPVVAAACIIRDARKKAFELDCLASTGMINAFPGSVNTIPEKVVFSLDLRSRDVQKLEKLEQILQHDHDWTRVYGSTSMLESINQETKAMEKKLKIKDGHCLVEWRTDSVSDAVKFDESCIECVENSIKNFIGTKSTLEDVSERMTSGAGSF